MELFQHTPTKSIWKYTEGKLQDKYDAKTDSFFHFKDDLLLI